MGDKVKRYYKDRVKLSNKNNFLWQVGKTVGGKEVSSEQINIIVTNIANRLQLENSDVVLDIGCGNGILTKEISGYISNIVGIELTPELYEVAVEHNSGDNISYTNANILLANAIEHGVKFTKVYLYEVIQHLSYQDANVLFETLREITTEKAIIFIGGILDIEKIWNFFDTTDRRHMYFKNLLSGNDSLGTWYHKDFLNFLANKYGFNVECIEQDKELYTCHYRFDCVLYKR